MKALPNISKWKFKKLHKPDFNFSKLCDHKFFLPSYSEYAIRAIEPGKINYKQLESCRRALRRGLGKIAEIKFCIALSFPLSKKPVASRMGKGKGGIVFWIAVVRAGKIIVEINSSMPIEHINVVLKKALSKLPIKTEILKIYF